MYWTEPDVFEAQVDVTVRIYGYAMHPIEGAGNHLALFREGEDPKLLGLAFRVELDEQLVRYSSTTKGETKPFSRRSSRWRNRSR